ncbi:hypothetical protein NYO67_11237 [Aspergillus flavus]|nr:hypothetical protein NYO67_11237 [Aspergillus flavus]
MAQSMTGMTPTPTRSRTLRQCRQQNPSYTECSTPATRIGRPHVTGA